MREQDQFRLISQRTSGWKSATAPASVCSTLSDRMEAAMGRIPLPSSPWGGKTALKQRLQEAELPQQLWLASSGPPPAMERKLNRLKSQVEQAGFRCEPRASDLTHARLLRCRSQAKVQSE